MKAQKIIQYWRQVRKGLIATIEKFSDEELSYVPFDKAYSVRQIMLHIAQEEYGEIQYGITRKIEKFPPEFQEDEFPTIESIKELLASVHSETYLYLESLGNDDLDYQIEVGWGGTYSLIDLICHVVEHEIHHRGELSLILGLLGHEGFDA